MTHPYSNEWLIARAHESRIIIDGMPGGLGGTFRYAVAILPATPSVGQFTEKRNETQ